MNTIQAIIAALIRFLFGVKQLERLPEGSRQGVFFANHTSNLDFLLLWSVLPPGLRARTRPVAARDYWSKTFVRQFIAKNIFRALLIDRRCCVRREDPLVPLVDALDRGQSLIIFPEGTRNPGVDLGPLKSGIYHLHRRRPEVPLVPVWLHNCSRVLPKGAILPIPLLASVAVGAPLETGDEASRRDFLACAKDSLLQLQPKLA